MSAIGQFANLFYKNFIGELRQVKRNLMLFAIPIGIFLFVYLFFTFNKVSKPFIEPLKIGLIVEDKSIYAGLLADGMIGAKSFSEFVEVTRDDRATIYNAFYKGHFDAVVEMPDGFVESIMSFSYNPIVTKINYTDPLKAVLIKNILLGYEKYITSVETGVMTLYDEMEKLGYKDQTVALYNEQISYQLIFAALSRSNLFTYKEIVDVPSVASTIYYFFAILVMFLMTISVYSAIHLIREREEMCFVRLKITQVSFFSYMLSKALSTSLFISLLVFLWTTLFMIFTKGTFGSSLLLLGLFLMIALFFNVSLAMVMTAFIEREEGVILLSNVFIFINAIIGGSIIPIQMMPDALQKLAVFSPNYWMIRTFLYFQSGYNINEGMIVAICLLVISFLFLSVTSLKFKRSW